MSVHPAAASFGVAEPLTATSAAPKPDDRDLLRFITCGSVDDGKSTLIGRLLYDSRQLLDDQVAALARDSERGGADGLDLALLLDGLSAEREQGITIDVAYRFFATERRSFIVADTPGHEQYTRNMATGASTADAAVLLVDARKGLSVQTRRHPLLLSTLGIRHVVLAINKMDLVGWSEAVFADIREAYRAFAAELGFASVIAIPMSAKLGDNVTRQTDAAPWYRGPTLLGHLEELRVSSGEANGLFRLPVQWVNRPHADFRGFAGMVSGGAVRVGQPVVVRPSGERTSVARIVTFDGDLPVAEVGLSVTLTLADEVDVSRGSVIAALDAPTAVSEAAATRLFWMAREMLPEGASYIAKLGTRTAIATVARVTSRIDLATLQPESADALAVNDVGDVVLRFDRALPMDSFAANRDLGTFILIDRESFDTVAMGLVLDVAHLSPTGGQDTVRPATSLAEWTPDIRRWLPIAFAAPWRSLVKTASWRLVGTTLTVAAAFALTGDLRLAALLGVFELAVKSAVQFGHERLWTHVGFGLRPAVHPSYAPRARHRVLPDRHTLATSAQTARDAIVTR